MASRDHDYDVESVTLRGLDAVAFREATGTGRILYGPKTERVDLDPEAACVLLATGTPASEITLWLTKGGPISCRQAANALGVGWLPAGSPAPREVYSARWVGLESPDYYLGIYEWLDEWGAAMVRDAAQRGALRTLRFTAKTED